MRRNLFYYSAQSLNEKLGSRTHKFDHSFEHRFHVASQLIVNIKRLTRYVAVKQRFVREMLTSGKLSKI